MTNFEKLQNIIRDVLQKPDLTIAQTDSVDTVDGWDSLATVHILTAASQEFGRTFTLDDFENFGSVSTILAVLESP